MVSGLAIGIKIFSCSCGFVSISEKSSFTTNFLAARSVIMELIIQVNNIITTVPFNTSSLNNNTPGDTSILFPTKTAANVAAA